MTYTCGYVGIGTTAQSRALDVHDGDVALTSGSVNHGMTDILPSNAYMKVTIDTIDSGGVDLVGATSGPQGVPFSFIGAVGTSTPTAGFPVFQFSAMKKNGTGW